MPLPSRLFTLPGSLRRPASARAAAALLALATVSALSPLAAQAGEPAAAALTTVSVSLPSAPLQLHLNQVALDRLGPKTALVEYRGDADGGLGRYRIHRDGQLVASGALQALPPFEAWGSGRRYFAIDFSEQQRPGSYRVEVEIGGQRVRSAPVRVQDQALFRITAKQLLAYFRKSRHLDPRDHHIRVFDTPRFVDVWGGWRDAGGDTGKYLSHLGYANHFNPQQASLAAWVLAYTADSAAALYQRAGLLRQAREEAFWGADYLHRVLDAEGYFYTTVFDKWGDEKAERMVVGYEGEDGRYTAQYRSAYRAGAGMAIAALARAAQLAGHSGQQGAFSGAAYLADAERAFTHLQSANTQYCADGQENIIDDYTALMAAVELYRATQQPRYLAAARQRATQLMARQTSEGGFSSDAAGQRPYYHAVEAGLPLISLAHYLDIEPEAALAERARRTLAGALAHQLQLNSKVANPFDYARQQFRLFKDGALQGPVRDGFFIPHQNETGYWWQGESARLASLSVAAVEAGRRLAPQPGAAFDVAPELARFAQHQLDWTLGRNPYGISMLYGFGSRNPPTVQQSAGDMYVGGVSNGITGAVDSETGEGIAFAPGPDDAQWRWVEQWIPHSSWLLLAAVTLARP
ncbi:glycoside hydrolase family 9 protein [Paucibacter sp. APW11]|uniref:Glycoside hydrolase family 9 protein n=1 Tax=Roseateles aquae TaxID=3077235 RepID=A0ABU3PC70_9BURK|nr:glycoside hydrolase family 9 protein [Paucibacter sp. APW11]MDT9000123.1 glycoside hydrolase family 9 protein [Paucibacter sp. APW11]